MEPDFPSDKNDQFLNFLERQQKKRKRRSILIRLLFLVALVGAFYKVDSSQVSQLLAKFQQSQSASVVNSIPATTSMVANHCDAVSPPNGGTFMFDPSAMRRSDVVYSGLNLTNQHNFPVVLLVGSADRQKNYQAVSILPGQSTEVSLPVGGYGLTLLVGRTWCNINEGFSDGHRVVVNNLTEILPGKTNQLRFESIGPDDTDLHLISTQVDPQPQVQPPVAAPFNVAAGNVIELQRQPNGGFYVNGTVKDFPVVFQIDTGASITSIPRDLAMRAGIYSCNSKSFETANGTAYGCMATASELTFGNNRINGFEVAVMPNLKGALLGMNVLRYFKIENAGDIMRISSGKEAASAPTQYSPTIRQSPLVAIEPGQATQPGPAVDRAQVEANCKKIYDTSREIINARMRQGYSSEEGELFRERLRQIDANYRMCRGGAG